MINAHNLPDELLSQIASQQSLIGVSRRLHAVSLPYHYGAVSLTRETLPLFARSIVERPELGRLVHSLSVEYEDELDDDDEPEDDENAEDDGGDNSESSDCEGDERPKERHAGGPLDAVTRAAKAIDPALGKIIGSRPGAQSALLVLLFWHLPKLFELEMVVQFPSTHFWRACLAAIPSAASLPLAPALVSVQTITLSWYDTEGGLSISDMLPLFFLPKLTQLRCFSASDESWDSESSALLTQLQGRSSLTSLALEHSAVEVDVLADVIRLMAPGALASFNYDLGGATVGYSRFDGARFVAALAPVYGSLKRLELTGADGMEDDDTPVSSLRAFTALTDLTVDTRVLFGDNDPDDGRKLVEMLPPYLQRLRIRGINWVEDSLMRVLKGIPTLKTLYFGNISPLPKWILSCCDTAGVAVAS